MALSLNPKTMRHAFRSHVTSCGMRNVAAASLRRWTHSYTRCNIPRKGDKGWMIVIGFEHPLMPPSVVVGMSGGVDSSVAACLLAERVCRVLIISLLVFNSRQDYDLSAIFMRNWDTHDETGSDRGSCEWEKDWEDVQRVCRQMDIPCTMVNLS